MDILNTIISGAGHILSGGALGAIGAIANGYLDLQKTKENNKQELAVMAANLEAAKAAGANLATIESIKLAGSSYEADKASYANASAIDIYRGSVRPTVCYFLVLMSTFIGFWAYSRVGISDPVIASIAVYSMQTCLEMASMSVSWFFGTRYMAKGSLSKK